MIQIKDLQIEKEILTLLDFTHNGYAKKILSNMLENPLQSVDEIILRQNIIKGFIANNHILKGFSYTRTDLYEVNRFLELFPYTSESKNNLRFRLLLSESFRHQTKSKFIQVVLLFHKLHTFYFARLSSQAFPESYAKQLKSISDFLSGFKLAHYELLIREHRFKIRHIIELVEHISKKIKSSEIETFWNQYFLI